MHEQITVSPLARIYAITDRLTLENSNNLLLSPLLRTHLAEIVADVAMLSDEELVKIVQDIDTDMDTEGRLWGVYEKCLNRPPRVYTHSPELTRIFAMQQLRHELVSRRLKEGYPIWFAGNLEEGYLESDTFLQASVLAGRISEEYFDERDKLRWPLLFILPLLTPKARY